MSRTWNAPRWGFSAAVAGALALLAMALAAVASVPRADAAFTTTKCAGPDIIGRGASFANEAHKVFNFNFKNNYCNGTSGFGVLNVEYEALGSGAGRLSMKVREDTPRFGMSDEPPTEAEVAQMNAGTGNEPAETDANPADNGQIHVIPAAVGSVAAIVNFPNGCDATKLAQSARTDDAADTGDDALIRVRFSKEQFEKVWAKDPAFDEWDEVFPELEEAGCEDVPIIRVVRWDNSGTTFAFKDYLDSINGAREWETGFENREWPNATFGDRDDCGDKDGTPEASDPDGPGGPGLVGDTDQLTSSCANGNGNLVSKLIEVDGSIGYSDVATARTAGLTINPAGGDRDVYWTQIENGADAFVEPTADAKGFRTDGSPGANCGATEFEGIPANTFGDWSAASGVKSKVGYGICTMTYGLVFDDNADVWGNSAGEEAKARTVKDYWENIVSEGGQAQLFGRDYSPLPPAVIKISRAGVESVGWDKGEGGGGEETTPPPPPKNDDDGSPIAKTISNKFSVTRKTIDSKTGGAIVTIKLPGAGRFTLVGTAKTGKKKIQVGKVVLKANRAGTFKLALKPSAAAKKWLRKKGSLRVSLRFKFVPNGGSARSSKSAVVLKLKKAKTK